MEQDNELYLAIEELLESDEEITLNKVAYTTEEAHQALLNLNDEELFNYFGPTLPEHT